MSRLSIFDEDDKVNRTYKSSLSSLGFKTGYMPSSKEIDEAYIKRKEYLASTLILEQSYANLYQPVYRYERIYEHIQYQYLLKQYDILYKYYYLLEKEGITKDSEKILKSYEDEYEKCLNDIRHIETESNIIAELITNGIDSDTLNAFVSGLEKRDLDEVFTIDNDLLSVKISDLKQKINDLYYQQSSKSRIDIKKDYISKIKTLNDITTSFPDAEPTISNYLKEQSKVIVFDDVDLSKRREQLNDVNFISSFLTHPINGNPNTNKGTLISKLTGIKTKYDCILKLKRIDYIKLFMKKILDVDNNNYLKSLANFKIALNKLDAKRELFNTYASIVGSIIDSTQLNSQNLAYIDGLLNSFNHYLDKIKIISDKNIDIDKTLNENNTRLDAFCKFKERAINENIMYRYVNLRNQIISYYDQLFIPINNRKTIYRLLTNYQKLLKDSTTSIEEKMNIVDYLADFANTYCSDNTLNRNRPLA